MNKFNRVTIIAIAAILVLLVAICYVAGQSLPANNTPAASSIEQVTCTVKVGVVESPEEDEVYTYNFEKGSTVKLSQLYDVSTLDPRECIFYYPESLENVEVFTYDKDTSTDADIVLTENYILQVLLNPREGDKHE